MSLSFSCSPTGSHTSLPSGDELEPGPPDPSHLVQPGMGLIGGCISYTSLEPFVLTFVLGILGF